MNDSLPLPDRLKKVKKFLETTHKAESMIKERDLVLNKVDRILDKLEGINGDSIGVSNSLNEIVPALVGDSIARKNIGLVIDPVVKEDKTDAQVFSRLVDKVTGSLIRVTTIDEGKDYTSTINRACNEIVSLFDSGNLEATIDEYISQNKELEDRIKDFMAPIDAEVGDIVLAPSKDEILSLLSRSNADNDFIQRVKKDPSTYNRYPHKVPKGLPRNYFDGSYKKRVENDSVNYSFNGVELIDPGDLYKPNFQVGGGKKTSHGTNFGVDQLRSLITDLVDRVKTLYKAKKRHRQLIDEYNTWHTRYTFHNFYLILCATNQVVVKDYVIYKFINRGVLRYLLRGLTMMSSYIDDPPRGKLLDATEYLRKYHFITIKRLLGFVKGVDKSLKTEDVVDIQECSDQAKANFHLLSHFKTIIDSFNRISESRISVFVRINDWGTRESTYFSANKDDYKILDIKDCRGKKSTIKFTEVFGSEMRENGVLSNYMALQSVVGDKGVVLMSYGYSGVGKTYTLFGDGKEQGILQSTLESINGLSSVNFRIFELYGKGVAYPHYWNKGLDSINQIIISYDVALEEGTLVPQSNRKVEANAISDFIRANNTTKIDKSVVDSVMRKFSSFVKEIEKRRVALGTIKKTPNNPVSSRSILVYDFGLVLKDKETKLLIIDLPGREEIVETYVDRKKNKEDTLAQLFASLNPLALPIVFREGQGRTRQIAYSVIDYFNSLPKNKRALLLETKIRDSFVEKNLNKGRVTFIREGSTRKGERHYPRNLNEELDVDILNETISERREDDETILTKLSVYFRLQDHRFIEVDGSFKATNYTNRYYIKDSQDSYFQYESLLAVHLLNRMILLNMHTEIRDAIKASLGFNAELPMEGIYINENITGIIKYLTDKAGNDTSKVRRQNTDLTFKNQLEEIREWVKTLYENNNGKLVYNSEVLDDIMTRVLSTYKSNAIFNFTKPVITDVLEPYISQIDDYKVLYLLTNKNKKCQPQIDLLSDTRDFIESITKRV